MINTRFLEFLFRIRLCGFSLSRIFLLCLIVFSSQSFSQLANGHDKYLGNASDPPIPASYDTYWNQLTPGNVGKWGTVEGIRDSYIWTQFDQDYEYAMQRGFAFKHHILVQGIQQPSWITQLDSAEQVEEIEEWFKLVGERYPDLTLADVVGEVISNKALYRNALGGDGVTGWDWVIKAFKLAKQYLPAKTKKILLEANIINGGPNFNQFIQIVNLLKDSSLIDGIGLVAHNLENVDTTTLRNSLDQLWATGVDIYVHSLDIGSPDDNQQLTLYRERFPILWEHPGVKGVTLWGYVQGQTYQPNGYLLRTNGTERPALSWLREYLTFPGSYRSFQSGTWNDVNTWEQYNGTTWIHPVPASPSTAQVPITILSGHTITVTANDSGSNIEVASGGTLVINSGVNFIIKNSTKNDITVKGTVANSGTLLKEDDAEIIFSGGGKYSHMQDGGSLPSALWRGGSTVQFESIISTAPTNANQDFSNVFWNCPGQTSNLNLGWNGNTISGNITIENTGTTGLYMCDPQVDSSVTVYIKGDVIQTGGQFSTNGTSNENTTITINHNGNINITGGNFSISSGSQGGTGTTSWNLNGNFSISNAAIQNSNSSGAKFIFTGTQTHNLTLGEGNTLTALPIEVSTGATLNLGISELQGSGIFILNPGATFESGHPDGLNGNLKNSGIRTLSTEAGYGFSGATAQVTGDMLPDQVENLIMNNDAGVTLSKSVTVNGIVDIKKTGFSPGSSELIYGQGAVLRYSGTTGMSTADNEFPAEGGPDNVIIDNSSSSGIMLHAPRTIKGNLLLSGKFRLGDNNFTAATADKVGSTDFVVTNGAGSLILPNVGATKMLFPVGTTSYTPVWIANNGTGDNIGVRVESDVQAPPEGGRVKAKWTLTETTAGEGDYTLTFGWLSQLEDALFKQNRSANAGIFLLGTDTTEAGSGDYTTQFVTQPYTVSRGGINSLGSFGVGKFGNISSDVKELNSLAVKFSLSQNYPNPFNPATQINYSIPQSGYITLKVYNLLGQEVTTLFEGFQQRGNYTATFDGSGLSSGVYIYRLTTENFVDTKKTVLLK